MMISIIIPAYNAERFIATCLDSVYRTVLSHNQFEVIVINDGSQDSTLSIINRYEEDKKNLKLIDKENEGVSVARNSGISIARGDYVLFLDADDELVDGAFEKVFNYLSNIEPVDMLVTRQVYNYGNREDTIAAPSIEEHKCYTGLEAYRSHYVRTNAGGGICRRAFLAQHNLKFPEGITNGEDGVFFAHLQVYARAIVYYNIPLYRVNVVEGSASRKNHTRMGLRLVNTLKAVGDIRESLQVSDEQKGIFDYVVYQMLSNTLGWFAESKELNYHQLRRSVDFEKLLPLHSRHMHLMKKKAILMNFSFPLFYFLCWLSCRIK